MKTSSDNIPNKFDSGRSRTGSNPPHGGQANIYGYKQGPKQSYSANPSYDDNKTRMIDYKSAELFRHESIISILDGSEVREYDLNSFGKDMVTFGRDTGCDIVITSPLASRTHGIFRFFDSKWHIIDSGSKNGTYLNGVRLLPNDELNSPYLIHLDIIRIDNISRSDVRSKGVMIIFSNGSTPGKWRRYDVSSKPESTIGRNSGCDIVLSNVNVSRIHARLIHKPGGVFIADSGSLNGIFVNGRKVNGECRINEKDAIVIANLTLIYTDGDILYKSDSSGVSVQMQNVSRYVKSGGEQKLILNNVNLTIEPNEFIAIIGGSGAGKSTVMNAMSGFEKATSGRVLINNIDLYKNYNEMKSIIGYVPQQDIIHESLTLYSMLKFSAKLRMPKDVSRSEIESRIDRVLRMVDLFEHKHTIIRRLSGGQKKRASIAVELLGDPGLFFLDEPTSGLDPGTEEMLMKTLSRLSKQNGKTIIMVTHTTQNLHLCDKIIFMGKGGKVCYYGSPENCLKFFNTDNLAKVYNMLLTDSAVDAWASRNEMQHLSARRGVQSSPGQQHIPKMKNTSPYLKQLMILCHRYAALTVSNISSLIMLLLQPIGISLLITVVAGDTVFETYNSTKSIMFAVSCGSIWIGLFSSIQEICKERVILKREYMANLRLSTYVLSKYIVLFIITAVQSVIISALFFIVVGHPEYELFTESGFFEFALTIFMTGYASAALGLLVSCISKNADSALRTAPFILIVQLLFSGILFELGSFSEKISYFTISKWSVAALGSISNLNELSYDNPKMALIERDFEDIFEFAKSHVEFTWMILLIMVVICGIAGTLLLRNISKDSR